MFSSVRALVASSALVVVGGVIAATALAACDGRPRLAGTTARPLDHLGGGNKNVVFDLSQARPESTASGGFLPLGVEQTYWGLVQSLEQAAKEPAPGYLLRFGTHEFSWAQTQELGRLLAELRASERPVVCHGDSFSNISMWLAAAGCDEIWLSPAGTVDTVGLAGQSIYLKRLLDKLHVKADFLHVGRYKSAAEALTEDSPSEAAKESMVGVLRSMRDAWLAGVREARAKHPYAADALENGPWVPKAAVGAGLVDRIGYETAARERLVELSGERRFESSNSEAERRSGAGGIARVLRALGGGLEDTSGPRVVVLPAAGSIAMEAGGGMSEEGITADQWTRLIRRVKEDESIKAVVLRIDSPGGSALASDLLWNELVELRKVKPLVASVGAMAASGGYYLACSADVVLAEHTSIVGSIGVVGGKIVLGEALDELGVSSYTFSTSDDPQKVSRAAYMSALSGWDDATRARVQEQMEAIYDLFVERVAEGRKLTGEQVRAVAEGRIWSGAQGLEHHLVDRLGGLAEALREAKQRAGLPPDAEVSFQGPEVGWMDLLGLGEAAEEDPEAIVGQWAAEFGLWKALSPSQRATLGSLHPLLAGERVVAAMPYSIELR